jgi:hypothetical protein
MPFKSEKQRRYLWANEPEVARDWTDKHAGGGMIKKAIINSLSEKPSLQNYAKMRSGGLIGNGSLTPGKVRSFKAQCKNKFRDS